MFAWRGHRTRAVLTVPTSKLCVNVEKRIESLPAPVVRDSEGYPVGERCASAGDLAYRARQHAAIWSSTRCIASVRHALVLLPGDRGSRLLVHTAFHSHAASGVPCWLPPPRPQIRYQAVREIPRSGLSHRGDVGGCSG